MKKCCIFGAGSFDLKSFCLEHSENAYVIAADGGYKSLLKLNIVPDLVVGDFDSLKYVPNIENVIRHNVIKDETDMALAFGEGIKAGCDTFYIYGALGGRIDHSFANLQLLTDIAKKGKAAYLIGEGFLITAICNNTLKLDAKESGIVSIFCVGEGAKGVCIKGLKYELSNYELSAFVPLGVSNEFIGNPCEISVGEGVLLVMIQTDEKK